MPGKPVIETDRLVLREMGPEDLDFIAAMLGDPDVMRYWPRPYTRDEAAEWIARQQNRYETDGHGYWLALEKRTNEPVGQAGLMMCDVDGRTEPGLGYIIHRPFWRRGFATEATRGTIRWAFDECGYEYVIALVRPENTPSSAVAERVGMTPARHTTFAGFDHIVYSIARGALPEAGV